MLFFLILDKTILNKRFLKVLPEKYQIRMIMEHIQNMLQQGGIGHQNYC